MEQKGKIVLFFPKLEEYKPCHWFPISSLALAAPLITDGYRVVVIDERVNSEWEIEIKKECQDAICFGVTAFTGYQIKGALNASRIVKKYYPRLPVVWGGPHVTSLTIQSIKSAVIDVCVRGYAEYNFKEIVRRFYEGDNLTGIPGIVYKDQNGNVFEGPDYFERFEINQFNNLPRMPYELIDIDKYINPETHAFIYVSSYGCPSVCSFCSTKFIRRHLKFNIQRVMQDIEFLLHTNKFKRLVMADATFLVDEERVISLAKYLKKAGIPRWGCYGRAIDLLRLKDDTLRLLEESNAQNIVIGLETGSPRVAVIMKKGKEHPKIFKDVIRRLTNYKINITSGVVFGIPGEDIEDLKVTLNYIKEIESINPNFRVSTTFFQALPGTGLYEYAKNYMGIKFPDSIDGWAERGEENHHVYNQFVNTPYISPAIKEEYFKIYEDFWKENKYLQV